MFDQPAPKPVFDVTNLSTGSDFTLPYCAVLKRKRSKRKPRIRTKTPLRAPWEHHSVLKGIVIEEKDRTPTFRAMLQSKLRVLTLSTATRECPFGCQAFVARLLKVSRETLNNWTRGAALPRGNVQERIDVAYGVAFERVLMIQRIRRKRLDAAREGK